MVLPSFLSSFLGTLLGRYPSLVLVPCGFAAGVYLDQTYNLPDVEVTAWEIYEYGKEMERKLRKDQ